MAEVIGIDHIYVTVSDLEASEQFYDRVMIEVLAFRKNKFRVAGDPHIQYFNRSLRLCVEAVPRVRETRPLLPRFASLLPARRFRG